MTVKIITPHFNPTGSRRLAETYHQWIDRLGDAVDLVTCYELTFDDAPPEIPGSHVIRGDSTKNLMWQKEALINQALRDCDPAVEYFAWIDHDLTWSNGDWISRAVDMINGGVKFVQLFGSISYLDQQGQEIRRVRSREAGDMSLAPGGAWMADRVALDAIGGLYDRAAVGEGDEWTWLGFRRSVMDKHNLMRMKLSRPMFLDVCGYIGRCKETFGGAGETVGFIDEPVQHIWHGDRKHRQYSSRSEILKRHNYDPLLDVRINADGVLEWASEKPEMHAEICKYFADRRDDG